VKQLFRSPSSGLSVLPQSTPEPLFSSFLLSFYQSLFFFLFAPFHLVFYCIFYFFGLVFYVIHFLPSFFYPCFSAHMISSLVYYNLIEIKRLYMLYLYLGSSSSAHQVQACLFCHNQHLTKDVSRQTLTHLTSQSRFFFDSHRRGEDPT
jgi:hypothetical protein